MSEDLAAFLDDLSLHIEREIAKVPAPMAEALLRDDSPLSTVELLRLLAHPENVPGSAETALAESAASV